MLRFLWIPILLSGLLLACGGGESDNVNFGGDTPDLAANSGPNGERIFKTRCVTCHGSKGNMGANGAANLQASVLPVTERVKVITHGRKVMNAFKNILTPEEIQAVAEYSMTLSKS